MSTVRKVGLKNFRQHTDISLEFSLEKNEQKIHAVLVAPKGSVEPGTYIFNVDVRYDSNGDDVIDGNDDQYDSSLHKLYVVVG